MRKSLAVVVALCAGVTACGATNNAENGQPEVVTLVTHSSPGGGSDVFLRTMAPYLSRIMKVTIIVENMQGGSGAKAMSTLAAAKPDGGMFYATTPTFIYTSLMSRPAATYNDLEPLVNIFYDPEVLFTAADSKYATLQQVLDHARTGGGKWGAANPASLERQTMQRLKQKAGVNPAIATFEGGGDMLINVLNHTLDMGIGELQEMRGQLDAGKLRLLGVVADDRLPQFAQLQTVKEQGIDLSVRKFRGLAGPKGTPPAVIATWETAIRTLLDDPEYKKLYTDDNLQPGFIPHAEYVGFMNEFGRQTADFLKESGVIKRAQGRSHEQTLDGELVLGCATLGIAGGYYLMASRIQQSDIADVVGPQGLPRTYAALLAVLSIILIVRSAAARRRLAAASLTASVAKKPGLQRGVRWRVFGMLMNGVIYILVVPWLGYILSIAALIAATVYYQGGGLNRRVAAVAVGGALLLWLLFVRLLHIAHPAGIWPSLL